MAKSDDRSTFHPLADCEAVQANYDGIGIGLFNNLCGIDIDGCINDGKPNEFAAEILNSVRSYAEISPSGTGLHIICIASQLKYDKLLYLQNNRNIGLEIYISGETNRYLTLTGNRLNDLDICDCSKELQAVLDKYMWKPSDKPSKPMPIPTQGRRHRSTTTIL